MEQIYSLTKTISTLAGALSTSSLLSYTNVDSPLSNKNDKFVSAVLGTLTNFMGNFMFHHQIL